MFDEDYQPDWEMSDNSKSKYQNVMDALKALEPNKGFIIITGKDGREKTNLRAMVQRAERKYSKKYKTKSLNGFSFEVWVVEPETKTEITHKVEFYER